MSYNKSIVTAGLIVYVNGRPLALGTNFAFTSDTTKKQIRGLDSAEVVEFAPTGLNVSGQIGLIRAHGDGGAEGIGLLAQPADLTREKYFTLLILDRFTQKPVFRSDMCTVQSQSWQIPSRGIITGTINFTAINWTNESNL